MTEPEETASADFFDCLPLVSHAMGAFDDSIYVAAPDDWALVVTDIVNSTKAIGNGRHKAVNFVAAMAIAALKNCCAPHSIPFLFGGDGAVIMVPPNFVDAARVNLARVRTMAARDHNLTLRIGMVFISDLRHFGSDVQVGRFEPTPGNSFGVFKGGGVDLLERTIKGLGEVQLQELAQIPESLSDNKSPDLSGLSCRWEPLRSQRGKMLTLIVHGAQNPGDIYQTVAQIAGHDENQSPAQLPALKLPWAPQNLLLEARARQGGSLIGAVIGVFFDTLIAKLIFAIGRPVGKFNPSRYKAEITTNTDFCKFDQSLCFVIDCPIDCIDTIRQYLDQCATEQPLKFGIDTADTALMTCLVTDHSDGLHVHFIDGGDGGYTNAARQMKR